ncbi:MAG: IreB family regulatory phosphoprotein [Clostridia bacterium]|nr:IreB family regulatory phosphoprotein [Clostridia bacterium]
MDSQNTLWYKENDKNKQTAHEVLEQVYVALKEKGYNPVNQIVGYLISGDPTYITSHMGARKLIAKYERDELMEELVQEYLKQF